MTPTRSEICLDDVEPMGNEQVREAELVLEVVEKVQDLRLDRYVKCRDRLVADDELGIHCERTRNAHALSLTARKLMRVSVCACRERGPRTPAARPQACVHLVGGQNALVRMGSAMMLPTVMRGLRLA